VACFITDGEKGQAPSMQLGPAKALGKMQGLSFAWYANETHTCLISTSITPQGSTHLLCLDQHIKLPSGPPVIGTPVVYPPALSQPAHQTPLCTPVTWYPEEYTPVLSQPAHQTPYRHAEEAVPLLSLPHPRAHTHNVASRDCSLKRHTPGQNKQNKTNSTEQEGPKRPQSYLLSNAHPLAPASLQAA